MNRRRRRTEGRIPGWMEEIATGFLLLALLGAIYALAFLLTV